MESATIDPVLDPTLTYRDLLSDANRKLGRAHVNVETARQRLLAARDSLPAEYQARFQHVLADLDRAREVFYQ